MVKPKSKLAKAKEKFIAEWVDTVCSFGDFYESQNAPKFRRQLNNLIRLAREEGAEESARGTAEVLAMFPKKGQK